MNNISAEIIRNLVSSVLKIDSRTIKLSGEISTEMECPNWSGNCHDSRYEKTTIYGFNPEKGLVELPTCECEKDEDDVPTFGDNAHIYPDDYVDCLFFVTISDSCSQMQSPESSDYEYSIQIFKAPDFKEYFDSIEKAEIARWKQWLSE